MNPPPLSLPFVNTNSFGPGRCWGAGQRSSTMRLVLALPTNSMKAHSSDWCHSFSFSPRSENSNKGQGDELVASCLMHMDGCSSICSSVESKRSFSISKGDHVRVYVAFKSWLRNSWLSHFSDCHGIYILRVKSVSTVAGDGTVLPGSTAYLLCLLEANCPH